MSSNLILRVYPELMNTVDKISQELVICQCFLGFLIPKLIFSSYQQMNNFRRTNTLHDVSGLDHNCPNYRLSDSSSEESSKYNFFSYCHSHFDSRYVIATNHVTDKVQRSFASKHGSYKFVSMILECHPKKFRLINLYVLFFRLRLLHTSWTV